MTSSWLVLTYHKDSQNRFFMPKTLLTRMSSLMPEQSNQYNIVFIYCVIRFSFKLLHTLLRLPYSGLNTLFVWLNINIKIVNQQLAYGIFLVVWFQLNVEKKMGKLPECDQKYKYFSLDKLVIVDKNAFVLTYWCLLMQICIKPPQNWMFYLYLFISVLFS